MTDRVTLTDEEAKKLTKAAKHLRDARRYWQDQPNAAAARAEAHRLFSQVVAAREAKAAAKALRDAAENVFMDESLTGRTAMVRTNEAWRLLLTALANEYDPQEEA